MHNQRSFTNLKLHCVHVKLMDGLITSFFKPVGVSSSLDEQPSSLYQYRPSLDTRYSNEERISPSTKRVEGCLETNGLLKLKHVQQRDPVEEMWALKSCSMRGSDEPTAIMPLTGRLGDLCDWRASQHHMYRLKVVNKQDKECLIKSLPSDLCQRYQERTVHTTCSQLTCSIRIKRHSNEIVVEKRAYPAPPRHMVSDLWAEVYRPLTCKEVIGNTEACQVLYEWLAMHKNLATSCEEVYCSPSDELYPTSALLLTGPTGSGKTAAIYACATELGIKVHEVSCSSPRDRAAVLASLREATLSHQVTSATYSLILIEEADIVFPADRGFWPCVEELLVSTRRPFIFTSNEPCFQLRIPHQHLTFSRPPKMKLSMHLQVLALCHSVHLSSELANQITEYCKADIRRAFNYLQMWLCWSSVNLPVSVCDRALSPMVPCDYNYPWRVSQASHQSQTSQVHTKCEWKSEFDLLGCSPSTSRWWSVEPVDSLCDEERLTSSHPYEGVRTEMKHWINETLENSQEEVWLPHEGTWPWMERVVSVTHHSTTRVAMVTDLLPIIRSICDLELHREATNNKRRFSHYLRHTSITSEDLRTIPRIT